MNFTKIAWETSVKALGTNFGFRINYEDLWMEKFAKFKKQIDSWRRRSLTLKGKKLLINSYIVPIVSFMTEIYADNISENFIRLTNNLICDFLWKGKAWKIAKKTVALRKFHGGIEISNLEAIIEAKKCSGY